MPGVEERLATAEAGIIELRNDVRQIHDDVGQIRKDLADRPSWGVAKVIAALSFVSAASLSTLATLLITIAN